MQVVQVDLQRLKVKETSEVSRSDCKKSACRETFPNKSTIEKHIEKVHAVPKMRKFHCKEPGCYETFPKKVALWLHIKEVHRAVETQESAVSPAGSGANSAMPADKGAQVKKSRRFHCKKMGCKETFPKKVALWLHIEEVHSAASPGSKSPIPADSAAKVKKTRRFHCKKPGCTETFPKKAALVQHMEAIHIEKVAHPVIDGDSIQKFKTAVKEALAHALPKKQSEEQRIKKAGLKSLQKKGGGGGHHHPQDTSEKESEDSSGKEKSGDISQQGQVVMMVWAGDDGGEVENQGVAADPLPPGSSE